MNRQQKLISIRCDELRRLSDGWDGPDSRAPTRYALSSAEWLYDHLDVVPTDDGGVDVIMCDQVFNRLLVHFGPDGENDLATYH